MGSRREATGEVAWQDVKPYSPRAPGLVRNDFAPMLTGALNFGHAHRNARLTSHLFCWLAVYLFILW